MMSYDAPFVFVASELFISVVIRQGHLFREGFSPIDNEFRVFGGWKVRSERFWRNIVMCRLKFKDFSKLLKLFRSPTTRQGIAGNRKILKIISAKRNIDECSCRKSICQSICTCWPNELPSLALSHSNKLTVLIGKVLLCLSHSNRFRITCGNYSERFLFHAIALIGDRSRNSWRCLRAICSRSVMAEANNAKSFTMARFRRWVPLFCQCLSESFRKRVYVSFSDEFEGGKEAHERMKWFWTFRGSRKSLN